MRIFTKSLLALALTIVCVGGAKAQTTGNKVGEKDYTSLDALPSWHTENCTATLVGEAPSKHMEVTRNVGITVSYGAQKMIASGIPTIVGGAYTIKLRVKGSEDGAIACQFGTWGDGNAESNYCIPITTAWQDIDVPFTSAKASESWVIIWVGSYAGTVSLEKVSVYYTSSPLFYSYDYTGKGDPYPWYHDNGWGARPTVGGDILTATNNDSELDNPHDYQFFVADNIFTETGNEYIVRATMKGSVGGSITCGFGTWSSTQYATLSFTDEYQAVECKVSGLSNASNNHVLFQIGKYVGTIYLKKIEIIGNGRTITITDAGFATYVSDVDLDYSSVTGLKAYKAIVDGTNISFTKVTAVPAGEGVLLQGDEGSYVVPSTTGVAAWAADDNAFVAGTGAAVATGSGPYNYILNKVGGVVGFYKANGQTVASNRAYLQTTTNQARIALDIFDDVTGINAVQGSEFKVNGYYDLQGHKVTQPTRGLYIVNGKKVIIK